MKHGWTYKPLGEVITVKSGYTPNASELSNEGDIPYFKVAEMNLPRNEKYLYDTPQFVITPKSTFPKGSIVFPKNGAAIGTNKKRILVTPSVVDLNTAVAIPNSEIESNFLYYIFQKIDFRLITRRGTVPTLDLKELKNITIPVPSKDEQISICSLLDKMNRVIEAKKEQLKELDNLAQANFYDMFGDPVTNEKGWETKQLGDTGEIVAGSTPSTTDATNWDGNINWVTPAELNNQLFYGSTQRKLTDKGASGLTLMPTGTVLLSSRAPIGKLAITTEPMCCNQGFKNIVCGNKLNNIFLYYYLRLTMDIVKALGVGATFKEVSKKAISAYPIILPPLPLQQAFAEKVEAIERQKELINQSLREVQTLFDSRMDYWFSEEDDDFGKLDKLD